MSAAGKISITVSHSRNQETITVNTTGRVGSVPVNTILSKVTYPSRSTAATPHDYWTAVLNRALTQLS